MMNKWEHFKEQGVKVKKIKEYQITEPHQFLSEHLGQNTVPVMVIVSVMYRKNMQYVVTNY